MFLGGFLIINNTIFNNSYNKIFFSWLLSQLRNWINKEIFSKIGMIIFFITRDDCYNLLNIQKFRNFKILYKTNILCSYFIISTSRKNIHKPCSTCWMEHWSRGSPIYPGGQEQMALWFTTWQTALIPQASTQGSRHFCEKQALSRGQSWLIIHSG